MGPILISVFCLVRCRGKIYVRGLLKAKIMIIFVKKRKSKAKKQTNSSSIVSFLKRGLLYLHTV